ncbi:MAG TPA: winged helix DNA-binding domain-containing protein [Chryseolinea sp.]|nr:winged helix DNA-binding domain-containing protein [Chryseolinea sp.]
MNVTDIIKLRLSNQQIASTRFEKPEEILVWLAAVQAQEFGMAKWGLGLRLKGIDDTAIEKSFNEGKIIRTHLLRPTWHFVSAADIRWMLALTAPRVHSVNKYYYKKFELDDAVFKRANAVFVKMLRDGKMLTRTTLNAGLDKAKIKAAGLRLGYIFMQAELEGIICSGPRLGKQFTYALLDERVPPKKVIHPKDSLAELSTRYFTSRGPATLNDFVWWSGLTIREAKEGVTSLDKRFEHEKIGDSVYIFDPRSSATGKKRQTTFLMPDYDEYGISYKDRSALFEKTNAKMKVHDISPYSHMLVVDGVISGTWKIADNKSAEVQVMPFFKLTERKQQAITQAVKRYKTFLGM